MSEQERGRYEQAPQSASDPVSDAISVVLRELGKAFGGRGGGVPGAPRGGKPGVARSSARRRSCCSGKRK
jgi:hypothetical protein